MSSRIDSFEGTQDDYIIFLETEVLKLRVGSSQLQQQPEPSQQFASSRSHVPLMNENLPDLPVAATTPASLLPANASCLNIIPWRPSPKGRKPTPEPAAKFWLKRAKTLVNLTPPATKWWRKVQDTGIYAYLYSGEIISCVLDSEARPTTAATFEESGCQESTSVDFPVSLQRIATFAQTAMRRDTSASLELMIARFQQLIVLSACVVLREMRKADLPHILRIVRICCGKDITDKHCFRVLSTALFVNRLIDSLDAHGWTMRATMLVLLCEIVLLLRWHGS